MTRTVAKRPELAPQMREPPTLPPITYEPAADFLLSCLIPDPAARPPATRLERLPFLASPPTRAAAAAAAAAAATTSPVTERRAGVAATAGARLLPAVGCFGGWSATPNQARSGDANGEICASVSANAAAARARRRRAPGTPPRRRQAAPAARRAARCRLQ